MFESQLTHQFPLVNTQVEAGLYCLKRTAHFMEKIVALQMTCATEMQKVTEHESKKNDRFALDQMTGHMELFNHVRNMMQVVADDMEKYCKYMMTDVVEPLMNFYKEGEKKRLRLVESEKKCSLQLKTMEERISTQRVDCLKLWQELQGDMRTVEEDAVRSAENPAKYQKKFAASTQAYIKSRSKTFMAFSSFEASILTANEQLRYYSQSEMPTLLRELEQLENRRLTLMSSNIKLFLGAFRKMSTPYEAQLRGLEAELAKLSADGELREFTKQNVARVGLPPTLLPLLPQLPCDAATVEKSDEVKFKVLLSQDVSDLLKKAGLAESLSSSITASFSSLFSFHSSSAPAAAAAAPAAAKPAAVVKVAAAAAGGAGGGGVEIPPELLRGPPIVIVRALYDFESNEGTDISFHANELIRVVSGGDSNEEGAWWVGRVLYTKSPNHHVVDLSYDPASAPPGTSAYDGSFPSNYTVIEPNDANMSLRHVLEVPAGRHLLLQFLKSEYSEENLEFWLRVETFRAMGIMCQSAALTDSPPAALLDSEAKLFAMAKSIVDTFIAASASSMVNINHINRRTILERMASRHISADLFDDAQLEIFKLLDADSFSRFKKAPHWALLLRNLK